MNKRTLIISQCQLSMPVSWEMWQQVYVDKKFANRIKQLEFVETKGTMKIWFPYETSDY